MGLTLRAIGVESPVDKNRQDFTIFLRRFRALVTAIPVDSSGQGAGCGGPRPGPEHPR
jgi:hypothetical protein